MEATREGSEIRWLNEGYSEYIFAIDLFAYSISFSFLSCLFILDLMVLPGHCSPRPDAV